MTRTYIMGAHVPMAGDNALQASCGEFDSRRLHINKSLTNSSVAQLDERYALLMRGLWVRVPSEEQIWGRGVIGNMPDCRSGDCGFDARGPR